MLKCAVLILQKLISDVDGFPNLEIKQYDRSGLYSDYVVTTLEEEIYTKYKAKQ